jgi:hypothetical protein
MCGNGRKMEGPTLKERRAKLDLLEYLDDELAGLRGS